MIEVEIVSYFELGRPHHDLAKPKSSDGGGVVVWHGGEETPGTMVVGGFAAGEVLEAAYRKRTGRRKDGAFIGESAYSTVNITEYKLN